MNHVSAGNSSLDVSEQDSSGPVVPYTPSDPGPAGNSGPRCPACFSSRLLRARLNNPGPSVVLLWHCLTCDGQWLIRPSRCPRGCGGAVVTERDALQCMLCWWRQDFEYHRSFALRTAQVSRE
jgi:hypothetical protein